MAGFNSDYGLLGSNKATEDKSKTFSGKWSKVRKDSESRRKKRKHVEL